MGSRVEIQVERGTNVADNPKHELETNDTAMAGAPATGKSPTPLGSDSVERGGEHGFRGGASGAAISASGTRPSHATRHIETAFGILSYAELAPRLARKVRLLEEDIENGKFDLHQLDDSLIRVLHTAICGDLVPNMAGFRRVDVTVGVHTPPSWHQVPILVRNYAYDLQARLDAIVENSDELLLEVLAFAEGRLLFIHPFTDFNGRVTRVVLRLILRWLDIPPVKLVPSEDKVSEYLAALNEADRNNLKPLIAVWRARLEEVGR